MGTSIGRCRFEGSQPRNCSHSGNITYYHGGDVRRTQTSGSKNIYTGTGDVWVIFRAREDAANTVFRVTGNVQTCHDY